MKTMETMDDTRYGKAALQKFGAVPDGFHIYCAEWLGEMPAEWTRMRVTGAAFKGRRRIPGTTMTTIVTSEEIAEGTDPYPALAKEAAQDAPVAAEAPRAMQ